MYEFFGYLAIVLTVIGQIVIGDFYIPGQACWLVANGLYLAKARHQKLGRAEIVRNVIMSAITLGLIIVHMF